MNTIHDEFLLGDLYVVVYYTNLPEESYSWKVYDKDGAETDVDLDAVSKISQAIIDRDEDRKVDLH